MRLFIMVTFRCHEINLEVYHERICKPWWVHATYHCPVGGVGNGVSTETEAPGLQTAQCLKVRSRSRSEAHHQLCNLKIT